MKVLKGEYKGIELAIPEGGLVRPTVDHFKKHIVRIAQSHNVTTVWDLFAGTGGVGIELLSLGATKALFVEYQREAYNCLRLNLAECNLKNPTAFNKQDITTFFESVDIFLTHKKREWNEPDLIFLDPPYGQDLEKPLKALMSLAHITSRSLILIEHVSGTLPKEFHKNIILEEIYGPKSLTGLKK
jgi:16S rRNA (guanine966-N2)-methyltransferase